MLEALQELDRQILPEDTMSEAGRKILLADLIRMLENEAGTRTGEDVEQLHDMRIATRRMRSVLRLLEPYYKAKPIRLFEQNLKLLASTLGGVRDLDVMLGELHTAQATLDEDSQAVFQPIIDRLEQKRAKARKKLNAFLESKSYSKFVEGFGAFVSQPGAESKAADESLVAPHQVRHVVPVLLHDHLAEVRAYDEVVVDGDSVMLHALRIEFKRLRYATSFFADVLGATGAEFVKEIKVNQDHLGRMNDITTAQQHLKKLTRKHDIEALDAYLERLQTEYDQLLAAYPAVWQRFNTRTVQSKLSNALLTLR